MILMKTKNHFPGIRQDWFSSLYIGLVKGLKVFFFYLAVLCLFRALYIGILHAFWADGTRLTDAIYAFFRGGKLSMQTAGVLTLPTFLPGFFTGFVSSRMARRVTLILAGVFLTVLSVLFAASFTYYRTFHANFNQMIFVGVQDDRAALFWTMVQQFQLPLRLLGALVLGAVLLFLFKKVYDAKCPIVRIFGENFWHELLWKLPAAPRLGIHLSARVLFLFFVCLIAKLSIFGGGLGWQTAVDWENAGVTRDPFLNEAILDSPQALYRAYRLNGRMRACNGLDFTVEDIRNLAANLSGKAPTSDNLDDYLTHTAAGAKIAKPRHVVLIISESLANWPLLDKYGNIPISSGLRSIIAADDADYCPTFLPNGASTVSAVTGIVTGFADANLYLTTMPESFAAPFPTASAPTMERLGYRSRFFYAGPATWERIGEFTRAQGFSEFVSRGDFGDVPGSVWGAEDEVLYEKFFEHIDPNTPSFDVLLNASNHSPYDIDLDAKGFDKEAVRAALPEKYRKDEELLRELGHYWYADNCLAAFVREVKEKMPDSLIIIVGDHADRYHIEKQPNTYERYGIPFIITGKGVHKGTLTANSAGSQIDIIPTVLDLIAPKGFSYEALGKSLAAGNDRGVNYGFWITRDAIGKSDTDPLVPEGLDGSEGAPIDDGAMQNYINAIRSISWWRPKYGATLDEQILKEKGR